MATFPLSTPRAASLLGDALVACPTDSSLTRTVSVTLGLLSEQEAGWDCV